MKEKDTCFCGKVERNNVPTGNNIRFLGVRTEVYVMVHNFMQTITNFVRC